MIRILLVDDESLTLELHREYISRIDGFEVVAECTGARAALNAMLDSAHGEHIDLMLLDMTMPDGSGLEVLRHLRSRRVTVDVIAITGVRDAETVREMAALGVVQYLIKPFTFGAFHDRLAQYAEYRKRSEDAAGEASQAEIDALLGASRPITQVELPKGLSAESLVRVRDSLRATGVLTAAEAAEALGMSRVSVRRYLEHLVDQGRVERSHRYHGRGRPESEYRWR